MEYFHTQYEDVRLLLNVPNTVYILIIYFFIK